MKRNKPISSQSVSKGMFKSPCSKQILNEKLKKNKSPTNLLEKQDYYKNLDEKPKRLKNNEEHKMKKSKSTKNIKLPKTQTMTYNKNIQQQLALKLQQQNNTVTADEEQFWLKRAKLQNKQQLMKSILDYIVQNRLIKDWEYDQLFEQIFSRYPDKQKEIQDVMVQILCYLDA